MKKSLVTVLVLLALVLVIGAVIIFSNKNSNSGTNYGNNQNVSSDNSGNSTGSETLNPGSSAQTINMNIQSFAFAQPTLTINAGDTVVWANKDSMAHTITSNSGNELESESLSKNETYSHTFTTVGTYNYHCAFHSGMKGIVIAQ